MTDTVPADDATLFPKTAGEQLREAREQQGLSLAEIAARTRVPLRQLEAIEKDDFAGLPSVTYAVGFAKAYARAVGLDEVAIAKEVRGASDRAVRRTDYEAYEIEDPRRTPSSPVLIGSLAIVVLLLIAVGLWYGTSLFRGGGDAATMPVAEGLAVPPPAAQTPSATPANASATGQVSLTATDEVWLRIYDAANKTMFEGTMKAGDHYDVPADADRPMINVGRPDKLQFTLNGSPVPPIGDGRLAIKDVGIGAAALSARGRDSSAPAPTPTPTPTPTSTAASGRKTGTVPPAFRDSATRSDSRSQSQSSSERRSTAPVVTRPNGSSPAEVAPPPPATAAPAPSPTAAPATAP